MTTVQVLILVGGILLVDTMVVGGLLAAGGAQWKRFAAYFPQQFERADTQRRAWQTIRLGIFNWGFSFTIAVDAGHVHLTPGPRIGKLMGGGTASIPLAAFAQVAQVEQMAGVAGKPPSRFGRVKLKLAGQSVELPTWVGAAIEAGRGAGVN